MTMTRFLDSWRSTSGRPLPSSVARTTENADAAKLKKARQRLSTFSEGDLLGYIESNVGGIIRNIRDWRTTLDETHLNEALIAVETERAAIEELRHRRR